MRVNRDVYEKIFQKYGSRCVFCGTQDNLEVSHILPIHRGGNLSEENFLLLCPNCSREMNSNPREVEFVHYLFNLLQNNSKFDCVLEEPVIGNNFQLRPDLTAEKIDGKNRISLVIECKNNVNFLANKLSSVISQIKRYKDCGNFQKSILAFPGKVPESAKSFLNSNDIELWDIDYISVNFKEQIEKVRHPYFSRIFGIYSKESPTSIETNSLISELRDCSTGKKSWAIYQKLVGKILEFLFCPPLENPISERTTFDEVNRRDFILPNYSSEGFWRFIRERYCGDYILVDAKNYSGKIEKDEALQILNYLKDQGLGLFALIFSRKGGSKGCEITLRDHWILYKKMVIVLDDNDVEKMLNAKLGSSKPEDIIGEKIRQFRISI